MNINSEYIQKKEFHTAFKGYSMEEVDKFLDILAVEFDRITKKNKELQDALDKVKYEGNAEQETDVSKLVSEVLVSAHKVADEIRKKAEADAEEIIKNKKNIEENELKDLIKEKKEIEDKIKFMLNFYNDFMTGLKNIINDFNLKIADIENNYKINNIKEKLQVFKNEIKDQETTDYDKTVTYAGDSDYKKAEYESDESHHKVNKEEENIIVPEIKKLSDEEKEKEIRKIIENKENDEVQQENYPKEIKKEKKIFNDYEEEKIIKESKKIDIANPDIISEFFGDGDERKY
ncbi:MAG: DivIVA domain-containing protein [Actinobacteria bacterium]|nr:DivIVA domain-containing protein [Actinomycetota bacterium]